MTNDMVALTFDSAREDWSNSTGLVKERIAIPSLEEGDRDSVIIKVHYAGFCGSDRGIWWRKAFGDMIMDSLTNESATKRTVGHEFLGEIVACGGDVTRVSVGDMVAADLISSVAPAYSVSTVSFMCVLGTRLLGFSQWLFCRVPGSQPSAWPTDLNKIRPEVAAIQEPFGNAVHACQQTDLRGKNSGHYRLWDHWSFCHSDRKRNGRSTRHWH